MVAAAAGRGGRGRKTRGNEWVTRWLLWVAEEAGVGETGGGVGGRHGVEGGRGVEDREGGRHERQRSAIHCFLPTSGSVPHRLWKKDRPYVCWSTPKEVWLTSSAEVWFATCDELCRSSSVLLLVFSFQGLGHAISRRAWRPSPEKCRVASLHGLCWKGPAVLRSVSLEILGGQPACATSSTSCQLYATEHSAASYIFLLQLPDDQCLRPRDWIGY